jgi:hypothetical protein
VRNGTNPYLSVAWPGLESAFSGRSVEALEPQRETITVRLVLRPLWRS